MVRSIRHSAPPAALVLLLASLFSGCSVRTVAVNGLAGALAAGGDIYASDDDPELVAAAVPFGLKTIEALLAETPRHDGLLQAAASGFTQYGYAFVGQEADFVEGLSPALQTALAALSAGEREVLVLRIVIELDGDQTARVLGISPTAVSTRLTTGIEKRSAISMSLWALR